MKRSYDVIGSGEGISGLLACLLLAGKGFSCLWVDRSRTSGGMSDKHGIALPVSTAFYANVIRQILGSVGPLLADTLRPTPIPLVQSILPGTRVDVGRKGFSRGQSALIGLTDTYLQTLLKGMLKPRRVLGCAGRSAHGMEPWEENMARGLSRVGSLNRSSYLRYVCSLSGMGVLDYGAAKDVLISYLDHVRGECVSSPEVEVVCDDREVAGIRVGDATLQARYYLCEEDPFSRDSDGFLLYGKILVQEEVLPVGMGDLLAISPPVELAHPLLLSVTRQHPRALLSVRTKIPRETTLTSLTEASSWAAGMVLKRLREIIPFFDRFTEHVEFLPVVTKQEILPWFRYTEREHPPSLFAQRRYINPREKLYLCDRMKCASLDGEGELFWGVCTANAVLRDLNRSDLYGSKTT
ncbi:MAG TPA: hypothetical protein ENN34_11870 [Deltaproteobacteria bacterium]|nr:hypothetical protein [Deltaproteobacteria bacterium]